MEKMKVYTQEEALDLTLGKKGTPERDAYDARVEDYLVGLAIRKARESKNLTQERPWRTHRCSKSKNMQY